MGLEAENTHICEPKKGPGDQLASPRWSRGGRKEVARRSRGGREAVARRSQGIPRMSREWCERRLAVVKWSPGRFLPFNQES